jgi:hypothetical protein
MSSDRGGGNTTYIEKGGGSGIGGILIGAAVLILVAIVAFVFLSQNRHEQIRTDAVTGAASSVAQSASTAADRVGSAADRAADNVTPPAVPAPAVPAER